MADTYTLKQNNRYEILTPTGYQPFAGVRKLYKDIIYDIYLSNGKHIKSSENHPFIVNGNVVKASTLKIGDVLDGETADIYVTNILVENKTTPLYDIVEVGNGNLFNVDGIISHNCDFVSSGDSVISPEILQFYKDTYVQEPVERGGFDGNLWKWQYPNYNKSYMVVADVARGDASDYSAAHVIDIEDSEQVAEYRGKLDTKDFGNFLVSLATDYNNALLVIENANIGWACIQQVIDRDYPNLYYMSKDLKYVDVEHQFSNKYRAQDKNMVAGFSTTSRTRPLILSKLEEYVREQSIIIRSSRTIDELFTFIWNNGRAEAMRGYNDDLTMSLAISLWVRDTALRLRQEGVDLTKRALGGISSHTYTGVYGSFNDDTNPWQMNVGNDTEDLSKWL